MKAQDIFGLVLRIFGLVFLYQGLSAVPSAINLICPLWPHFLFRNVFPAILMVGWPLAVGIWMVRGAPLLMRMAYERDQNSNPTL